MEANDLVDHFSVEKTKSRKSFLFSNTTRGANITMVYLSLIQSNGLDQNLYLQCVFQKGLTQYMTDDVINELQSYLKSVPESIKVKEN